VDSSLLEGRTQRALTVLNNGLVLLILAQCTLLCLDNGDFWMRIAVGRWIAQHRAVPTGNPFIHTYPNFPFVEHSWLSDLVFYGVYRLTGALGIETMVFPYGNGLLCIAVETLPFRCPPPHVDHTRHCDGRVRRPRAA